MTVSEEARTKAIEAARAATVPGSVFGEDRAAIVDALISLGWRPAGEADREWEYGWEADETIRQTMTPRGPKVMIDGYFDTPENLARFPKGRRIRRLKAGPWEPVEGDQATVKESPDRLNVGVVDSSSREALRERFKVAMRENGLTEDGGSPHSWRCSDKDRYPGPCGCLDELIDDLLAVLAVLEGEK